MMRKLTVHGQGAARPIILAALMRASGYSFAAGLLALIAAGGAPVVSAAELAGQPAQGEAAPAPPARPRIGLVLSGGGARGIAHVGVLRVLEELRVPVDAIAGTSMGAVVGGLYASGLSAGQIEAELDGVDWEDAFSDRPARVGLNYRRRREDRDFLVRLPLGFRGGRFQLPAGLIQGQKLTQLLREKTLRVAGVTDFDDLPTPFRAVATDLETGTAVVLGEGDLTSALRASMSVPGIFAPVERNGRLLVDGGVADNLPVDVARAMGVDRLIVVDAGFPLERDRNRLGSVTNVTNQMLNILIRREVDAQLRQVTSQDVLVSPAMPNVSSYSFTNLGRLADAGRRAAEGARDRLAQFAVSEAEYARYVAARKREPYQPEIRAVQAESKAYAADTSFLFGDLAGTQFDPDVLRARVNRYYGQGRLELLDYQLQPVDGQSSGKADLAFQVRPTSWGPNYLRFGLRLQDDFEGNSTFDAAARLLLTDLNAVGAEWVWDGQLGANPRLGTQLYLPFSLRRRWFLEPAALFQVRDVPQYEDDERVGELRLRSLRYGGSLGREIGNTAELRVGAERELIRTWVRLGDTGDPALHFQHNEVFARYSVDTLDSAAFPTRGHAATVEWRGQVANRRIERVSDAVSLDWRVVNSWGKNTVVAWGSLGALLDSEFVDERSLYSLGGFLNLSGLPTELLNGPNYGIGRLIYYRKVGGGGEGLLNLPLYAGVSVEAGNTWQSREDVSFSSMRKNASAFLGMDTFLGPAWLAVGYDSRGRHAFYLSLGRGF
jgi:NTE family protein